MNKNKDLSAVASAAAVLVLLLWVGTSVVLWRSPVEGAPQNPKRMLRREHPGVGEPVTITKVTVAGNEVEFKKEFDAGDEWFKSLAVTVENRSTKPITYIEIRLNCPRPPGSDAPMFVYDLTYGGSETLAARPNRPATAPGESTEFKLMGDEQTAFEGYLREAGYANLNLIDIAVRTVMWSDGTEWYGGRIWSKTSGKWTPTKPNPQPTRKESP